MTSTTTTESRPSHARGSPLDERILAAVIASFELAAVHLGVRLGWYRALAESAATAPELGERTGTDVRYAREWLEQQAVAGYLHVEDVRAEPDARRYRLPAEHVGFWSTSSACPTCRRSCGRRSRSPLDEFTFRFNRRKSNARGLLFYRLLQQAVETDPHPLKELVGG